MTRVQLDFRGNLQLLSPTDPAKTGMRMDGNDWMAAKLVGLFGLIMLALVVVYFFVIFD